MFLGNSIDVFAFSLLTGQPVSGGAGNITVYLDADDSSPVQTVNNPVEVDSVKSKGFYRVLLTTAEKEGTKYLVTAKSSASDVQVIGVPATYDNRVDEYLVDGNREAAIKQRKEGTG